MRTLCRIVLVLLPIVAGCGGGSTDRGQTCTQIGCFSGFFVSAPHIALDLPQIQASSLTVCRNGACLTGSFSTWDGTQPLDFPAAPRDPAHPEFVRVSVFDEAGGARFEISYSIGSNDPLQDGDVYDVTLTAGDGSTPISTHQTVTYARNQPNGPSCAPTCYDAFVQL
jgi:hypothetical protein